MEARVRFKDGMIENARVNAERLKGLMDNCSKTSKEQQKL